MRPRIEPSAELRSLAAAQGGAVTPAQAEQGGLSRHVQERMVRDGRWQRLTRGVLFADSGEPPWLALAWAGVLLGGATARLGGLAAAYLHGVTDDEPKSVLVWHSENARSRGMWDFRRDVNALRATRTFSAPPRTSVDDTVLDLCDRRLALSTRAPMHWLTAAVQKRLTTPARLRRALARRNRFGGRREVSELLADVGEGAQSPLEVRYLRDVERAHGLPRGARQARAVVHGRARFRDVRYEEFGVLVELDGKLGHSGSGRFRDYARDNAALLGGEVTLRFGWVDVTGDACGTAAQVAELLIRAGWTGYPTRCANCRG